MGETAGKLRLVFDAMASTKGVYLFDEFDAIGAKRSNQHDVGEVRRVLNSFLQFLEQDASQGLIVAATNHAELLDPALFRRFDDVIEYGRPDAALSERVLRSRLLLFEVDQIDWPAVLAASSGLAYADLVRAAEEAAKDAVLEHAKRVTTAQLVAALEERQRASERALTPSG
jgi:ATP-dependent 26S proteasome regulatory subunit